MNEEFHKKETERRTITLGNIKNRWFQHVKGWKKIGNERSGCRVKDLEEVQEIYGDW